MKGDLREMRHRSVRWTWMANFVFVPWKSDDVEDEKVAEISDNDKKQ